MNSISFNILISKLFENLNIEFPKSYNILKIITYVLYLLIVIGDVQKSFYAQI